MRTVFQSPGNAARGAGRASPSWPGCPASSSRPESGAARGRVVSAGDRVPDLSLLEVDLGPIRLHRLLDTGPVVFLFVRHARSPECGAALRLYRDTLAPSLSALGAHLVAVSPQAPVPLGAVKRRHELDFLVASDARHGLIDDFGIGFSSPCSRAVLGTGRTVLPFAATVVADRTGVVRFADVRADWSTRTTPGSVIAAVRGAGALPVSR